MINVEPELDACEVFNVLNPNTQFIAESQNGVHPYDVFGIVGEVATRPTGTMRKETRSSRGMWLYAQSYECVLNVGVQGTLDSTAGSLAETLRFMLSLPQYKRAFRALGYSTEVDTTSMKKIPMPRNTDMYVRYVFSLTLRYDILMDVAGEAMTGVDLDGTVYMPDDSEYKIQGIIKED